MAPPTRRLVILDVGHGNCAVLHDRDGVVVVDAGPGSALLEYLTEQKVFRLDLVLISHADKDHIGGLIGLLAANLVEIGRVCLNSDASKTSALWDDLLYELDRAHNAGKLIFEVFLVRDDSGQYDHGDVHVEVLAPGRYLAARGPGSTDRRKRAMETNTSSAVIRLSQHGIPIVVFPGDVDDIGLDNLLENVADAKAPILIFPHHGGEGGRNQETYIEKVCRAFAPSTVVFSVGRGRSKHPLPSVIELVRKHVKPVRIVCTQLSEHCAARTPKAEPTHLNRVFAEGQERRKCCGGTLVIPLDSALNLLPLAEPHQRFIDAEAPTAMCCRPIEPGA